MRVEKVTSFEILEREIRTDLLRMYGPMIGGSDLSKSLGYVSLDALTQDVAKWIAQSRLKTDENPIHQQ